MNFRVLLADDHALFRRALRMFLEALPDLEVVAEVTDSRDVIKAVERSHPDVVCMDVRMPGLNGVEATQQLLAVHPYVKVVAMSAHSDLFLVTRMINAGALAYVVKENVGRHLPSAIRLANQNQSYFSPELGIKDIEELTAYGMSAEAIRHMKPA